MILVMDSSRLIVPLSPDIVSADVSSLKGVAVRRSMSALGQERTYAPQQVMSALPQIATAKADSRKTSCLLGHHQP